jgi:hypothetical protein
LKFKDLIDWAEMLICPAVFDDADTGILSFVDDADLTVHRCQNELVLP